MIKVINLNSGIKLLLDSMDGVKSVSIGIWCNTGSVNERPEEYGISHFIEHMLFKGTPTRNAYQIVNEMESIGADINAFTSKERTCFYAKCIDEDLFKAADVLTDMVEHPLFEQEELEREKLVVIEEINMNADDPDDVAIEEFDRIVFDGSGLSHPVLGYKETVSSFNHDNLDKYYREHYTRDSLAISVAGSFDEHAVVDYFNKHFMNLEYSQRHDDIGSLTGKQDKSVIVKDIEQAHIVLGLTHVPASDERRYHMSILSTLLGGGMSSRLFQNVREKKGLAYSVYSSNSFYNSTGEFGIVAGIAKDRVDEAMDAIKEELDKLNNEPIEFQEFERARQQLKAAYIYSQESTQSRMRSNGINYLSLGYCPDQEEALHKFDNVTLEDIEISKKMISDFSRYTIVNVTGK